MILRVYGREVQQRLNWVVGQTLGVALAMEAGLTKSPMTLEEVFALIVTTNPLPKKHLPYKRR